MDDQLLAAIMQTLGELKQSVDTIEKEVTGNGQPGLRQRVEDLEASKNRLWGIGGAITFIGGIAEYFIHRKP